MRLMVMLLLQCLSTDMFLFELISDDAEQASVCACKQKLFCSHSCSINLQTHSGIHPLILVAATLDELAVLAPCSDANIHFQVGSSECRLPHWILCSITLHHTFQAVAACMASSPPSPSSLPQAASHAATATVSASNKFN